SFNVAVTVQVAPERSVAPQVVARLIWVAAPEVTVKLSVLVEVNGEVVETVTGPARTPVTVTLAVPPELVWPEKLTDPLPLEVKVTPAPPLVTVLPAASSMVAVATQVAPEAMLDAQPLITTWVAAPEVTVKLSVVF